jgi:tetratricopeptide (TPR) repeat protein
VIVPALPVLGILALAAASPVPMVPVKKAGQAVQVLPSEQSLPSSWEAVPVPEPGAARELSPWLGQEVVIKSPEATPSAFADSAGTHRRYRVERVDGEWLWIAAGDTGDWIKAADVVPAAEAERYFTDQLRQKPAGQAQQQPVLPLEKEEEPAKAAPKEAARPPAPATQTPAEKAEAVRNYNRRAMLRYDQRDFAGAIADYTAAIKLDPARPSLYNNRAAAWLDQGDADRAIADYTAAIKLDPKSVSAYHGRAIAWLGKGEYDRAIADDDMAIRLRPGLTGAYINRGLARFDKGELDRAMADFDEAIKLDPESASSYNNRGTVREARKDTEGALADYTAAIKLDPKYARAYTNRGRLREAGKDYVGALADYDEAVRLDPSNPSGHRARAWIWATSPDARLRDARTALTSATRACELTQYRDPACLETLAAAEAESGRFANAVKRQAQALALLPQGSPARASVAARLALYQAGKPYHQEPGGR